MQDFAFKNTNFFIFRKRQLYIDWTSDSNSIHRLNHKQARLQAMIQYIHDHYMEEISAGSLDNIII